jgi:hypothetical protein
MKSLTVTKELKETVTKCDANGDGALDREETKTECLVMVKSITKLSEKINETMAPTTLKCTKKPRARWILIKLFDDHLVKANSTQFPVRPRSLSRSLSEDVNMYIIFLSP